MNEDVTKSAAGESPDLPEALSPTDPAPIAPDDDGALPSVEAAAPTALLEPDKRLDGECGELAAPNAKKPSALRRAALLAASALCLASASAYVCAGIFVADAVMGRGARLFEGEIAALAADDGGGAIEAVHIAPETISQTPDDSVAAEESAEPESAEHPVERVDMSCAEAFAVANETNYSPDVAALTCAEAFAAAKAESIPANAPLVLVIHTHSTEAYLPEGTALYSDQTSFRSTDPDENMIAVGEAMRLALERFGISCLHCTENFDAESFIRSYEKSAEAVGRYLSENPSIRYVLDVHRDAIFRPDASLLAPVAPDGAAQVMLVCGTDEMGADFPNWRENLSFAFAIQAAAGERYPGLMRNVNLRGASFNEQLAERYLLVEVGSAGNCLAEAKLAAERFAEVFAAVIGADGP